MAEGVLEVGGAPPDAEEDLLVLYFESRRRSGGGPVRSCQRLGPLFLLTFESPQDAQGVLARAPHRLQGAELRVRPAPPWDPAGLLLRGLSPQTPPELLELYVERVLERPPGAYSLHRAGDWALLRLHEPLDDAALAVVEERVRCHRLEGAALAVQRLPQTDSVRVQAPGLHRDLLELYFENRRSGGGRVRAVRVLPGGQAAIVSFQEPAVVARVLQRPHQLQDSELDVSPYYEFLEPAEEPDPGDAEPAAPSHQESSPEPAELPREPSPAPSAAESEPRLQTVTEASAQERLALPAPTLLFLRREDVREHLGQLLAGRAEPAGYAVAEDEVVVTARSPAAACDAARLLQDALSPFTLELSAREALALCSPRWHQLRERLRCCEMELAPGSGRLQGLALRGTEQENRRQLRDFLRDAAPDETLVSMERGALRYLQRHYQDLLASIPEVSMLPLEGDDVAGFRVSGEAGRCQAAAEFLQSLLGTVSSQTVTLRYPGVARFLLDEGGQSILRQLESRFQCVLELGDVQWSPPDPQLELAELLPPSCCWQPQPATLSSKHPELPDGTAGDSLPPDIEEIKALLVALRTDGAREDAGGRGSPLPALHEAALEQFEGSFGKEWDPGDVLEPLGVDQELWETSESYGTEDVLLGKLEGRAEEEEEAQMLLAIQRSMDSTRHEDEELQRATALSLHSYREEQRAGPGPASDEEDAGLLAALEASLEEALPAADTARVTLYASFERDVSALPRQLEQALEARLRTEQVESAGLRALPAGCHRCLALLQRRHAVRLCLRDCTATLHGFASYTAAAARELTVLLQRLRPAERGPPGAAARWVRWDPTGTAVPYEPATAACLEAAWQRGERQLDVLLDGRPVVVDLQQMEEYDIGTASALPISRSEPPSESAWQLLGPEASGLDEEVRLMPLAEDSEEFGDTVQLFYATLEELYNKIHIVKVEKLIHPLLYKQYQLKKASMEKACRRRAVERVLFHGTTEQSSREICLHGFNRSFCGKNAALYGLGVYFAAKAAVSAQEQYSPCGTDGNKYIFVAKALTGDYTLGSRDMRAPPLREAAGAPRRYDSVVDNLAEPSIFVIFNDTQAYPQYLVTCRRSKLLA
ncbi:protein mono-ADP-ribosyltransferase PARP10 [Oxyura jamaicensis]|uniref:protein mono-ADP-ribosyltransferase PARP10 n=1 Tax=Oxyura jamaicensis TaxID=8884 RepID=UPI0015A6A1A8|nr:protein mono-ADP-ribosyltransferase PARP10 [Oxyura jamaicensis]